jgi:predicted CopG family antitoxin
VNHVSHVYEHLVSLKQDSRDSFSRVIRRHIPKRLDTAGELLDAYEPRLRRLPY